MIKKIIFGIAFFSVVGLSAQGVEFEDVYSADAFAPKFEGGNVSKFYDFINHKLDFTKIKKGGKALVSFTIDISGELKNIKILEFPDIDAATEIIRVLNLSPKWESATRNGKPFSTEIKIPLKFKEKVKPLDVSNSENKTVMGNTDDESKKAAQTSENSIENSDGLETRPDFPGGIKEFYNFIAKNYNPPYSKSGGKIIVNFVIEKDGSITDIIIIQDIGKYSADEAIRVLKKSPKWTPAEQNGKKVRCKYTLPITIQPSK